MPLHDVKCLRCDHIQEVFYLVNEKPKVMKCEKCKSEKTKYLIGKPAIKFGGDI